MIDLTRAAQSSGVSAKYVLFDSWFSLPKTITTLKTGCGLKTIVMVKKSSSLMDEVDDITFSQSMRIIIDALKDAVMEYF